TVPAPEGLVLSAVQIAFGAGYGVAIEASWDDPGRPDLAFEAQYRPSAGGAWVNMAVDDDARTARSGPVDSGPEYEVRVRALTTGGRPSDWTSDTIVPAVPELTFDFAGGLYRSGDLVATSASALPGYAYSRAGAKYEAGPLTHFAADVPGIVPGQG